MTAMQIGYGAFRHPVGWSNLVNFSARVNHSARGFKTTTTIQANVAGDIVLQSGEDEYDLDGYIEQLETAYLNDGLDWGLYHTDGSPTRHFLWSADPTTLTGNQIMYRSFPASHGGEYVTGRSFQYIIANEFLTAETPLLEYSESIEQQGDCGPRIEWVNGDRFNPPYFKYLSTSSYQVTVQHGYAITAGAYFDKPTPLLGRPWFIGDQSYFRRQHPRRHPEGYIGYRVEWKYTYITPYDFNTAYPTLR